MYVLLFILFINILCNITAICYFDRSTVLYTWANTNWWFKIPHLLWYWLFILYTYKILPYLIRIITCIGLAALILISNLWLPTKTFEQFCVGFGITFIIAVVIMASAVSWVLSLVDYLSKKKEKKETNE